MQTMQIISLKFCKKLKTGSLIKFLSKEKMEKFGDKANPHFNFGSSNKTEY